MPVCARMLTCTFGGKRTAFQNQFFPSTVGSGDQTLFLICLAISLFIHLYFETGSHETWSLPICLGLLAKELMVLLVSTPPALGLQTRTAVDAWGSNSGSHACATITFQNATSLQYLYPFLFLYWRSNLGPHIRSDSTLTLNYNSPSLPTGCFLIGQQTGKADYTLERM